MPGKIDLVQQSDPSGHHNRRNLRQRFEIIKTLGQGTYGKVKLALETETGKPCAIKSIEKKQIGTEQDLSRLHREIEIMTRLHHPHIISVYEVFENADKIILVMEYASGGELYDHCNSKRGLYDDEARKFFRQIVSAVHYLHKNGIVHRDLKLENIVLDAYGDAKIADFGFANIHSDDKLLSTFCGSPLYASPEIVNGLPYHGPEVDCWSLGVLLYAIVYGAMPFDGSDFRKLRNQITAGKYFRPNRPSGAEELIGLLLCPNATYRASIDDVISHWWMNLGYHYTAVDETLPGKPVDQETLQRKLSEGSFSDSASSDCDSSKHDNYDINDSQDNASQPSADCDRTPPIKGILKNPKKKMSVPSPCSTVAISKSQIRKSQSLDVGINIAMWCTPSSTSKPTTTLSPVFDSEKKPKKSILKKRHSHLGENYTFVCTDSSPVNDLISAVNDALEAESRETRFEVDSSNSGESITDNRLSFDGLPKDDDDSGNYDLGDIEAVLDGLLDDNDDADGTMDTAVNETVDSGILRDSNTSSTSGQSNEDSNMTSTPRMLISGQRKKGILKHRNNQHWRHSLGSQGSTSSSDLLDFSYDSTEGEAFFSEYFTMPLNSPLGDQKLPDLGMVTISDPFDDELGNSNEPPPLPKCPPPSHCVRNDITINTDTVEKIIDLGKCETSGRTELSGAIDWDEVQSVYREAMDFQKQWANC